MSDNNHQPLGSMELPLCSVCQLQPIPESAQHIPFIIAEILLIFYSLKLTIVVFFISYCFSKNCWLCPQCRREVEINQEVEGASQNLILRLGNCMVMLSKLKFRVIAFAIIAYILYLFVLEVHQKPKYVVQKSWRSLATNCGYEAILQNPFKANSMYLEYPQLGEWTIEGIFLREQVNQRQAYSKLHLKMDPSQFKNPTTEDFIAIETSHSFKNHQTREVGDMLRLTGQWQGRDEEKQLLKFVATKVQKLGVKGAPQNVKLLNMVQRFISVHEQQKHTQIISPKLKEQVKIETKTTN